MDSRGGLEIKKKDMDLNKKKRRTTVGGRERYCARDLSWGGLKKCQRYAKGIKRLNALLGLNDQVAADCN